MLTDDLPALFSGWISPDELGSEVFARLKYKQSVVGHRKSRVIPNAVPDRNFMLHDRGGIAAETKALHVK